MTSKTLSPEQQKFHERYITAPEIADELGVSRVSVFRARERGALPDAIYVGDHRIWIWERTKIRPHIDAWKKNMLERGR